MHSVPGLLPFLHGAIAMGFAVAGLYFLRFWRDTGDRLFAFFAAAFWVFAAERVSFAHGLAYHRLDADVRIVATSYLSSLITRDGWFEVVPALARIADDPGAVEQVIASAIAAFRAQRAWLGETTISQTDAGDFIGAPTGTRRTTPAGW